MSIKVILCDRQAEVVEAWKHQFDEAPEVDIRQGDILEVAAEVLVLPGNSFGFLDRHLALEICERFGFELQDRLRETIRERFHGELLVGQAIFTPLPGPFRELLYAPIARTPQSIDGTLNSFLAARGAFLALRAREAQPGAGPPPGSIVFPGLGTGSGGLHPLVSARQLRYAYEMFAGVRGPGDKNLTSLRRREMKLKSLPRSVLEGDG
jgi:O-acetyl-ADP-ribose deacetylase (regulator of RNase III)